MPQLEASAELLRVVVVAVAVPLLLLVVEFARNPRVVPSPAFAKRPAAFHRGPGEADRARCRAAGTSCCLSYRCYQTDAHRVHLPSSSSTLAAALVRSLVGLWCCSLGGARGELQSGVIGISRENGAEWKRGWSTPPPCYIKHGTSPWAIAPHFALFFASKAG